MPRRRMIDPDIWHDIWFGRLDFIEQVFFIGIISNSDDEGRTLADPAYLRSRIFIYRDISLDQVQKMVDKFQITNPNFSYYTVNGSSYIALRTWHNYQKPEYPKPSKCPVPPNGSEKHSPNGSDNHSPNGSPIDSPPSIVKYSIVKYSNIYSLWNGQGIIIHRKLTEEIKRAIDSCLNDYCEEEICQAIRNYSEILKSDIYYFKYSWTLKDFLKRGLAKFLDLETAKKNYTKDGVKGNSGENKPTIKHQEGITIKR